MNPVTSTAGFVIAVITLTFVGNLFANVSDTLSIIANPNEAQLIQKQNTSIGLINAFSKDIDNAFPALIEENPELKDSVLNQ